jgi:hypothetical protein
MNLNGDERTSSDQPCATAISASSAEMMSVNLERAQMVSIARTSSGEHCATAISAVLILPTLPSRKHPQHRQSQAPLQNAQ